MQERKNPHPGYKDKLLVAIFIIFGYFCFTFIAKKMKYKRILLKLSGESLGGEKGVGLDVNMMSQYAKEIAKVGKSGRYRCRQRFQPCKRRPDGNACNCNKQYRTFNEHKI